MTIPILKLNDHEIDKILEHRDLFEGVEEATGVPWEAVAAVWYRESFSVAPPKRVGGQFQFDPPLQKRQMIDLLEQFAPNTDKAFRALIVERGQAHFPSAAILAACWLRLKAKFVLTPDATDEEIADAFYGYNGRAYGHWEKSPYVCNGLDANHMDMCLRGTVPDVHDPKKKVWVSRPERRPGALCVYLQLKALPETVHSLPLVAHAVDSDLHGVTDSAGIEASINAGALEVAMIESSGDSADVGAGESLPTGESSAQIVDTSIS